MLKLSAPIEFDGSNTNTFCPNFYGSRIIAAERHATNIREWNLDDAVPHAPARQEYRGDECHILEMCSTGERIVRQYDVSVGQLSVKGCEYSMEHRADNAKPCGGIELHNL